jgi:ATP-dependent Lhr-like helicase
MGRRWLDDADAADLGRLDAAAIERVRAEAWPDATTADELHDALWVWVFLTHGEVARAPNGGRCSMRWPWQRRATRLALATTRGQVADRDRGALGLPPSGCRSSPRSIRMRSARRSSTRRRSSRSARGRARMRLPKCCAGRLQALGPVTADRVAESMCVPVADALRALARLPAKV